MDFPFPLTKYTGWPQSTQFVAFLNKIRQNKTNWSRKNGLENSFKHPDKKNLWRYSSLIFRHRKDIEIFPKKIPNAHWTKTYDVIDHMTACRHRKVEEHYK